MPRPRSPALSNEDARHFRSLVRAKLDEKGLSQRDLIALHGATWRNEKWIQNALSDKRRLLVSTANHIIMRLALAGAIRSPNDFKPFSECLPKKSQPVERAKLVVFPGQSHLAAKAIAERLLRVPGIGNPKLRAMTRAIEAYLADYEAIFRLTEPLAVGDFLENAISEQYGNDWKELFDGMVGGLWRQSLRGSRKVRRRLSAIESRTNQNWLQGLDANVEQNRSTVLKNRSNLRI